MKHFHKTVDELIANKEEPPLPLSVIPNYMGINLVSVDSLSWTRQDDGQLVSLTIHFVPAAAAEVERLLKRVSDLEAEVRQEVRAQDPFGI